MLLVLLGQMSLANPGQAWIGHFLSPQFFHNAPIDGVLVLQGNAPIQPVLTYQEEELVLVSARLAEEGAASPVWLIYPPEGGWPVGPWLTVTVPDPNPNLPSHLFSFKSDGSQAAPPPVFESVSIAFGPWEVNNNPSVLFVECIEYTRDVVITVEAENLTSLWWGVYVGPASDATVAGVLDLQLFGSSWNVFTRQWTSDLTNLDSTDECLSVYGFSAAGELGPPTVICPEPVAEITDTGDIETSYSNANTVPTSSAMPSAVEREPVNYKKVSSGCAATSQPERGVLLLFIALFMVHRRVRT